MDNLEIKFKDEKEYFGMSGPWLADCYINGKRLRNKFLIDNFAFSPDRSKIALSMYSDSPTTNRVFRIILADVKTQTFSISKFHYESLFIESISSDKIIFHNAFHADLPNFRRTIKLSVENFTPLKSDEIYL